MQNKLFLAMSLASACYLLGNGVAQAQPDANTKPNTNANPNPDARTNRMAPLGMNLPFNMGQPLTPEQLRQLQAQQAESKSIKIRQRLTQGGFTDENLQKVIVDYVKAKDEAQSKLNEQYQKVSAALKDNNTQDTQLATLLNDLRASVEDEKGRQAKSLSDMSEKIDLAHKPRLDALLMTMGITGDEKSMSTQNSGFGGLLNIFDGLDDLDGTVIRMG